MNINDYLMDELKRLNRLNDNLEKKINQCNTEGNEPEQIVNNAKSICEISDAICNLHSNGII